jgi:hypothetical protein
VCLRVVFFSMYLFNCKQQQQKKKKMSTLLALIGLLSLTYGACDSTCPTSPVDLCSASGAYGPICRPYFTKSNTSFVIGAPVTLELNVDFQKVPLALWRHLLINNVLSEYGAYWGETDSARINLTIDAPVIASYEVYGCYNDGPSFLCSEPAYFQVNPHTLTRTRTRLSTQSRSNSNKPGNYISSTEVLPTVITCFGYILLPATLFLLHTAWKPAR